MLRLTTKPSVEPTQYCKTKTRRHPLLSGAVRSHINKRRIEWKSRKTGPRQHRSRQVVFLWHYSYLRIQALGTKYFLNQLWTVIWITPKKASLKMPGDNFDSPRRRSVKIMGTSLSRKPNFQAMNFISI